MRISSVSPALAKEKAEEAVSDVIGVMTSASDAAYSKYNDGMNPYYRVTSSWNEIRISANITSYLSGCEMVFTKVLQLRQIIQNSPA